MTGSSNTSLSDPHPNDVEKVTSALLELKIIRSKSGERYEGEDVKNVMICLPCREKYYAEYEHYVTMDQVKGVDVGTYLNRKI